MVELTAAEARGAYDCLIKDLVAGYGKSGLPVAGYYKDWKNYASQPYVSDTHGGRYVNNYGNSLADSYGEYEKAGRMPVGAVLAKDSFVAKGNGKLAAGPLFLMEKMPAGFNKDSGNWRYTMVLPNGQVFGTTNGADSAKMKFCYECHMSVAEEQDSLMFLPEEYRAH
ncbi:MAG: cytochrome P460 family protein [Proteobacteria bacterium]|nr:cytochrome P460 family protein [Pseudomonadota bacterium]